MEQARNFVKVLISSATLALFLTLFGIALGLYGVIDVGMARFFLLAAWASIVLGVLASDYLCGKSRRHIAFVTVLVAIAAAVGFVYVDRYAVRKRAELDVILNQPPPSIAKHVLIPSGKLKKTEQGVHLEQHGGKNNSQVGTINAPGGVVSVGQSGGITAQTVYVEESSKLIRTLSVHILFDVPTQIKPVSEQTYSLGLMCPAALFNDKNKTYILDTTGEFEDWQINSTTHRYGFVYTPKNESEFAQRSIGILSDVHMLLINCSEFFKRVNPSFSDDGRPIAFEMTVLVNGVKVIEHQGQGAIKTLTDEKPLASVDVSREFSDVEKRYEAAMGNNVKHP